jgi:myo-inositol-1(or 4)-monophosphatase
MTAALKTAFAAVDIGRKIALKYWRSDLAVRTKRNWRDLVTQADLEIDAAVRRVIRRQFPHHAIVSEELADQAGAADYTWYIDPIDGTVNFTMGEPIFGVSIGLLKAGEPVLGVIDLPALSERYWAAAGDAAWWRQGNQRAQRLRVSTVSTLKKSKYSFGFSYSDASRERFWRSFQRLLLSTEATRIHYSCVYDSMNVARGGLDFYINYDLNPWDSAAALCIVRAAGGAVVTPAGRPATVHDKDIVVTNRTLTKSVLRALQR